MLANIQAHVLLALIDPIVARTGGTLILSGLLSTQVEGVVEAYVAAGLTRVLVRASTDDPAWSCAVLRRS